ncbi:MAG: hypothetical protein H0T57_01775, partial [Rubrobacter sp.]|nr:hypothetical protein [Rubrobacter sp.]
MGRSWRKFFRRSEGSEEESGTIVETQESYSDGAVPEESEPLEAPVTTAELDEAEAELEEVAPEAVSLKESEVVESEALEEAIPEAAATEAPAMTDETIEEESGGWFGRLRQGMRRSRESFVGQLNAAMAEFRDAGDEEFWERVEEILITSDVGV